MNWSCNMNREQRRKAGIKTKTPTYNFTMQQINKMVEQKAYKLLKEKEDECVDNVMKIVTTVPLWVLRTKFGYGKERLARFIEEYNELIDSINKGYLNFDDINEALKNEVGTNIKSIKI